MFDKNLCELFILLYCVILSYITLIDLIGKTRPWTKELTNARQREIRGYFDRIYIAVKEKDEKEFRTITRMALPQFNLLFTLIKDRLTKVSNRTPIGPECRLVITLLHLAHGCPRKVLASAFRMGTTTIHKIILETCEVIWDELKDIYLSVPNESEWARIARRFYEISGMPNCVGAIDGKHVNIVCPPRSGSAYYNYKGHHSIVLMACCDADYCFTFVDIGAYGSKHDSRVFFESSFGRKILNGSLPLPPDSILPNSEILFPYYFVADAAFPLRNNIMKPYPGRLLSTDKEYFNRKLSSARRMIENTFGIMCVRWRMLLNTINCHPKNAQKIVKAIVVLHNFVKLNDVNYCPIQFVDHYENGILVEGQWRRQVESLTQYRYRKHTNSRREAFDKREVLKNYINLSKTNT